MMTEKCVDCGNEVIPFWGISTLYEGVYCINCYKKRNPPVKKCPECSKLMLKKYGGRLHKGFPPSYNFKWICQCGYDEDDIDSLKKHYIDQLLNWLNENGGGK